MKEITEMLDSISDQVRDVFEHFDAIPHFKAWEEKNPYGGNPTYKVEFSADWRIPMKAKTFSRNPAFKTVDMLRDEIKAYLFDCIDTFCNL